MRLSETKKWLLTTALVIGFEVYGLHVLSLSIPDSVQTFNPACDKAEKLLKNLQRQELTCPNGAKLNCTDDGNWVFTLPANWTNNAKGAQCVKYKGN